MSEQQWEPLKNRQKSCKDSSGRCSLFEASMDGCWGVHFGTCLEKEGVALQQWCGDNGMCSDQCWWLGFTCASQRLTHVVEILLVFAVCLVQRWCVAETVSRNAVHCSDQCWCVAEMRWLLPSLGRVDSSPIGFDVTGGASLSLEVHRCHWRCMDVTGGAGFWSRGGVCSSCKKVVPQDL